MKKGFQRKRKGPTKAAKNKRAFDDVVGDPYGFPEPIDGHYMILKCRSSLAVGETEQQSKSPVNNARPNPIDFFCDVESAVEDGLKLFINREGKYTLEMIKELFDNTYLLGTGDILEQPERAKLEQDIGSILVQRSISPVAKYFTTIKQ